MYTIDFNKDSPMELTYFGSYVNQLCTYYYKSIS